MITSFDIHFGIPTRRVLTTYYSVDNKWNFFLKTETRLLLY